MRLLSFEQVERVVRSLNERIRQIVEVPVIDGDLITEVAATTTGVDVTHGLGRTPHGAFVVRADTAATYVFDDFNSGSFTVTSSSDSTIDLWVF